MPVPLEVVTVIIGHGNAGDRKLSIEMTAAYKQGTGDVASEVKV